MTTPDDQRLDSGGQDSFSEPDDNAPVPQPNRPLSDREVPISAAPASSVLDQWLDGEVPMAVAQSVPGGGDSVDLWTKINDEAEVLRSRTTPLYVHKRIMDALPADTYRRALPWYRRPISVSPLMLVLAVLVLLGAGATIATLIAR